MGFIHRIKAGIEQGRKEVIREQRAKEGKRLIQKRAAHLKEKKVIQEAQRNPSNLGKLIGRTAQHTKPVQVVAARNIPKIRSVATDASLKIRASGNRVVSATKASAPKVIKGMSALTESITSVSPMDSMLLSAPVQVAEPAKRSKKKRGKQREEVRRIHTLDDDLLFGGGGGGGLLF